MSKIIDFPLQRRSCGGLTRDNMNWAKMVDDIQKAKGDELRTVLQPMYTELIEMISSPYPEERIRFLNKVKCSMDYFLKQDQTTVDYPLYYLLIYFIEQGDIDFYSIVDTDDIVHVRCANTIQSKTIAYMLDQFRVQTPHIPSYKLEEFLAHIMCI